MGRLNRRRKREPLTVKIGEETLFLNGKKRTVQINDFHGNNRFFSSPQQIVSEIKTLNAKERLSGSEAKYRAGLLNLLKRNFVRK